MSFKWKQYSGIWTSTQQAQAVAAGTWTGIILNELYSWGLGGQGRLGLNNTTNYSSPVQVGSLTTWSQVSSGSAQGAAIKTDGTLWMWGRNNVGQLGFNNTTYVSSPVQVGALSSWLQVSTGYAATAAIKTDGTLWTWGMGLYGELGHNNITYLSSPVQVGALTSWAQVAKNPANGVTGVIKTDGTLWMWGLGNNGRLGQGNNNINYSSPVQIGALANWYQLTVGGDFSAAIKTDGSLWTWGNNFWGQLGNNTAGNLGARSSPVQVGALTNWSQVSGSSGPFTLAVKTDGTLWSWGLGNNGRLGLNNTIARSSPVQVGALTNWASVSAGNAAGMAIKTDGTLWSWGQGSNGELGNSLQVDFSSPVQIGALTDWTQVSMGNNNTSAIRQTTT